MLQIHLFGEPRFYASGILQNIKLQTKTLELLAMLALSPDQPLDRAKLAFTLWPDAPEQDARANVRRHLHMLARALASAGGDSQLVVAPTTAKWMLDGPSTIDVTDFVRLSAFPDTLKEAAVLYTGELLANLYEDWLEAPRERLRKQQLQNLLGLCGRYQQADPRQALEYAESALRIDPWCEDAVRAIVDIRTHLGDRAGAVHAYSDFERHMKEELGAEPAPATKRALHDAKLAEQPKTNLPRQLTTFVGREQVVPEILGLLKRLPLVSLVGAGGVGKTRCAIQTGAELLNFWPDGVWFADLAPISNSSLVPDIVARALGVQELPNRAVIETLTAYLHGKRMMLIIDNCEHVIVEARRVVSAILQQCAQVHVLATSREALNISGEQIYRMPSLSVPPANQTVSGKEVFSYAAPLLFNDRASSADAHFTVNDDDAMHIAEICRRLDGIPLAIELAAARVSALSPRELAHKLDERFRVLVGGDRSALPRHRTMRALIDWSYELLSDEERMLFRRLSIFAGSFSLECARAVGNLVDEITVFNVLSSLVDKSLVQCEPVAGGTRYRLLESTRQYARERLVECAEYASVAHAHATALLALAQRMEDLYETTPDLFWSAEAALEIENWRAALEWALTDRNDIAVGQRLAGALQDVWLFFSPAEGFKWIRTAKETVDGATSSEIVAKLDLAEAHLDRFLHAYKAGYDVAQRALVLFERTGDVKAAANAKMIAARHLIVLHRAAEAEALLDSALASAKQLGLPKLTCSVLDCLAFVQSQHDVDAARERYIEALDGARAAGCDRIAAIIAANLGELEFERGNAAMALQFADESLEGHRRSDIPNAAMALCNSAAYLVALGNFNDARARAREALAASRNGEFEACLSFTLLHLATIAALRPPRNACNTRTDYMRAARLVGYAVAHPSNVKEAWEYTEQHAYDQVSSALERALSADEFAKLMEQGSAWSEDRAVAEAALV